MKKTYRFIIFISLFAFAAGATSAEKLIDQAEFLEVRQAVSAQDLLKIQAHFREVRVLQGACRRQVQDQMVPFACYELKSLVPADSLLTSIIIPEEKLQQVCIDGVAKLSAHKLNVGMLPKGDCLSAVLKKLELNRYKHGL
jgi:hypothetical protein